MRNVPRLPLPERVQRGIDRAAQLLKRSLDAGQAIELTRAYATDGIKAVLRDRMFERLCCFCESDTETAAYGEVEHYRPKAHPEFRTLAHTWTNLFWSCKRCNLAKLDDWNHAAPLLDPCTDDPTVHLGWDEAKLVHRSERGRYTVDKLDLNGMDHLPRYESRRRHLALAHLALEAARADPSRHPALRQALSRSPYRAMLAANGVSLPPE